MHGGDVMRFAGDSMICAFLPTPEEAASQDRGLAAATLRSVQCAWNLAESLGKIHNALQLRPCACQRQHAPLADLLTQ